MATKRVKSKVYGRDPLVDAMVFAVRLVAVIGSKVFVGASLLMLGAAAAAQMPVFGDGPSPAAMNSSNIPGSGLSVYYNTKFYDFLYTALNKVMLCTRRTQPAKSGISQRGYMAQTLGPDTVPVQEGTIGQPEIVTTNFKDIKMVQYGNYLNISDYADLTSVTPDMVEFRRVLAYQLGFTMDDIVMLLFDYLRTFDSRTANQDSLTTPYAFTKKIIEQMPFSLQIAQVPPMDNGRFQGSIHPAFKGDLFLDNSNNSIVDIWKHTEAGQMGLKALSDIRENDKGGDTMFDLAGATWRTSTNQTTYANWQGGGTTGISTYCAGKDAMIFLDMESAKHTKVVERWQNLNLWMSDFARSAYDPNNYIKAGTGYNAIIGVGLTPDPTTSRARIAVAVPQTT